MKITKVDAIWVDICPADNPSWSPVVCRVYTDEGLYGDGEAAIAYCTGSRAAWGMIQGLAELIIGMDPLENEVIWEKLYKSTFWAQGGGPIIMAGISAIDIALWDIKGKYYNSPVYKLLGGKQREDLRTYASQLQFGWTDKFTPAYSTQEYVDNAKAAVSEGFDAIKIDFFTYCPDGHRFNYEEQTGPLTPAQFQMMEERLSAVREAVGPNVDIIQENHSYIDAQGAVQLGHLAEKYNVMYFEEPSTPNPKINKLIYDKINVPIAHGERIYSRWGFAPYFENGSVQMVQPDIGNCGGITETKKVCDMAHVYDVGVQVHCCASPICTAAALQLEAVIPNFVIHEHHVYCRYQHNKELCKYDYQPVNGRFAVPDKPGIGNELTEVCWQKGKVVTIE